MIRRDTSESTEKALKDAEQPSGPRLNLVEGQGWGRVRLAAGTEGSHGFKFGFGFGFGFGLGLESGSSLSVGLGLGSFRAEVIHRVARRAARRAGVVASPAAGAARLANLGPIGARHVVLHLPARVIVGRMLVHSGWRRFHQC